MKVSKIEADRYEAKNYVHQYYPKRAFEIDESKALIEKNLEYFILYSLMRGMSSIKSLKLLAKKIGIEDVLFQQILSDYLIAGYIKVDSGNIFVVNRDTTIDADDERLMQLAKMSNLIIDLVRKEGGIKVPERVCHGFIIPMNEKTFELIHETHKQFIKNLLHLSKQVKEADHFMLMTDLLYVLK